MRGKEEGRHTRDGGRGRDAGCLDGVPDGFDDRRCGTHTDEDPGVMADERAVELHVRVDEFREEDEARCRGRWRSRLGDDAKTEGDEGCEGGRSTDKEGLDFK